MKSLLDCGLVGCNVDDRLVFIRSMYDMCGLFFGKGSVGYFLDCEVELMSKIDKFLDFWCEELIEE